MKSLASINIAVTVGQMKGYFILSAPGFCAAG